jgi:hypothetical protein
MNSLTAALALEIWYLRHTSATATAIFAIDEGFLVVSSISNVQPTQQTR